MILLMLGIWRKLRSAPTHLPHQLCGNVWKYAEIRKKCFLCLGFPSGATKNTRMIIQQGIRETIWSCLCSAYIFHDCRKFFIFHASKLLSCLRVVTPDMLWPDIFWYYFCTSGFACWALRTCASGWPLNTASQVQFDIFHLMPAEVRG